MLSGDPRPDQPGSLNSLTVDLLLFSFINYYNFNYFKLVHFYLGRVLNHSTLHSIHYLSVNLTRLYEQLMKFAYAQSFSSFMFYSMIMS